MKQNRANTSLHRLESWLHTQTSNGKHSKANVALRGGKWGGVCGSHWVFIRLNICREIREAQLCLLLALAALILALPTI